MCSKCGDNLTENHTLTGVVTYRLPLYRAFCQYMSESNALKH